MKASTGPRGFRGTRMGPMIVGGLLASAVAPAARAADGASSADVGRPSSDERPPWLRFGGLLHADWVVVRQSSLDEIDPASGKPLNEDRFLVRRARVRLGVDHGWLRGRLELDANNVVGPTVRPFDANLSVRWPRSARPFSDVGTLGGDAPAAEPETDLSVMLTMGLFRVPFGRETSEPITRRPFLERAIFTQALFRGARDLGIGLDVQYRYLNVALAVMNGSPFGSFGVDGLEFERGKDLLGRLGVDLEVAPRLLLELGLSGLSGLGLSKGSAPTKDSLAWSDGNEDGLVDLAELTSIAGAPARPSRTFGRAALGGDVRLRFRSEGLGETVVQAEIVWSRNLDRGLEPADPMAAGRTLRQLGGYVSLTQEFGRWLQIGVRYDRYDPDADAWRRRAADLVPDERVYATWSCVAVVRLPGGRFFAQYDHVRNPLGIASNGATTTLADDAFTVRGEVRF